MGFGERLWWSDFVVGCGDEHVVVTRGYGLWSWVVCSGCEAWLRALVLACRAGLCVAVGCGGVGPQPFGCPSRPCHRSGADLVMGLVTWPQNGGSWRPVLLGHANGQQWAQRRPRARPALQPGLPRLTTAQHRKRMPRPCAQPQTTVQRHRPSSPPGATRPIAHNPNPPRNAMADYHAHDPRPTARRTSTPPKPTATHSPAP